ncbi:TniB family NTP-binding protein [Streptomyces iakyrus]|uniref:TniB family NTP-binding protein n=1 Tax=Streptomyces iakyrus TaxID=68219 RepID=UPI00383BA83D
MTSPARNHHATTDTEPLLPGTHAAEPEWPITTWQGWQHFATTPPLTPPQPGDAPRSTEERLAYHSAFVTVRTPAIDTLATQVRTLMLLGRHQQNTARPSLIVTGPAAAGKTTALLEVGRTCHLAHTRKHPAPPGRAHEQVPVAYLLVPPGATAKTLAIEFARYLGIPVTNRMTQAQITSAVCHTYTQAGVRLVLIDEIHRLNPRTTTGAEAADLLKDLTERIKATFVYSGIDVAATPLFSGIRGAQLAGRASLITCGPLPARHGIRALHRPHHRHGNRPRPGPAHTRLTPPPRHLPPPAHCRPHRKPRPPHPPGSHHRHLRRHRTHHQKITRSHPARPPRRRSKPPPNPPTGQNGMMRT